MCSCSVCKGCNKALMIREMTIAMSTGDGKTCVHSRLKPWCEIVMSRSSTLEFTPKNDRTTATNSKETTSPVSNNNQNKQRSVGLTKQLQQIYCSKAYRPKRNQQDPVSSAAEPSTAPCTPSARWHWPHTYYRNEIESKTLMS